MNMILILLILLVAAALWSVMTPLIIRAAISLALTSAILTIIMFKLNAPLAGVFELSVCSGLISVIFISVISLTHRLPHKEYLARRKNRIFRFWFLPALLVLVAWFLWTHPLTVILPGLPATTGIEVHNVMWNWRQLDLFGQVMALLAGAYGVAVLFKGSSKDGN